MQNCGARPQRGESGVAVSPRGSRSLQRYGMRCAALGAFSGAAAGPGMAFSSCGEVGATGEASPAGVGTGAAPASSGADFRARTLRRSCGSRRWCAKDPRGQDPRCFLGLPARSETCCPRSNSRSAKVTSRPSSKSPRESEDWPWRSGRSLRCPNWDSPDRAQQRARANKHRENQAAEDCPGHNPGHNSDRSQHSEDTRRIVGRIAVVTVRRPGGKRIEAERVPCPRAAPTRAPSESQARNRNPNPKPPKPNRERNAGKPKPSPGRPPKPPRKPTPPNPRNAAPPTNADLPPSDAPVAETSAARARYRTSCYRTKGMPLAVASGLR